MDYVSLSIEILAALALIGAAVVGVLFRRFEVLAGVAIIAGSTYWHANIVDRWGETNVDVDQLQQRFDLVPLNIGDWEGEDQLVTDEVQQKAGAVVYLSRAYTNHSTGQVVSIWLAVGHARDICRHTPTVCYPSQGLRQQNDQIQFTLPVESEHETDFWTAKFRGESGEHANYSKRVFWAWAKETPDWQAPKYQRITFRNTKSLYKLYFTSLVGDDTASPNGSASIDFAKLFLPILNKALFADLDSVPVPAEPTTNTPEEVSSEATDTADADAKDSGA